MTETEIMKALEYAESKPSGNVIWQFYISRTLLDQTINLIKCQKAEINRKNAEIERLKYCNEVNIESVGTLHQRLKTARAEAIKEFAERVNKLIDRCFYDLGDFDDNMSMKTDVDRIAKEMGVGL